MPKRGKKRPAAEDGEEPKTGEKAKPPLQVAVLVGGVFFNRLYAIINRGQLLTGPIPNWCRNWRKRR